MSEHTHEVTDGNFEESVLKSTQPVLVDFWAEWCGPCRMIAPTVEALAADYDGRVTVGKMNVDDNPATPGQYGVRSIPTLLLFKDGQVVESVVGLGPTRRGCSPSSTRTSAERNVRRGAGLPERAASRAGRFDRHGRAGRFPGRARHPRRCASSWSRSGAPATCTRMSASGWR